MATWMSGLKVEIARLSRKEIHRELEPARKILASQRGLIADLRRQVMALQGEVKELKKAVPTPEIPLPAAGAEGARFWITGAGMKSMRKRLRLTQAEFGLLAGVTPQAVVSWEKVKGKVPLRRKDTRAKMMGIRALNKKSARAILEKLCPPEPKAEEKAT